MTTTAVSATVINLWVFTLTSLKSLISMNINLALTSVLIYSMVATAAQGAAGTIAHSSDQAAPIEAQVVSQSNLPVRFEQQAGQLSDGWRFRARTARYTVLFDDAGAMFIPRGQGAAAVRLSVIGSRRQQPSGRERLGGTSNYLSPEKSIRDVESFERVRYAQVADGIAQEFYSDQNGELEYDFLCRPGSAPEQIKMDIRRAAGSQRAALSFDRMSGELLVATGGAAALRLRAPRAFQQDGTEIRVTYRLNRDGTLSFALGAYDRAQSLRIDPVVSLTLNYVSYLGGYDLDQPLATAVDVQGNQYVTGYTESQNNSFPITTGAFYTDGSDISFSNPGAFVVKINPAGTQLVYATYIHGTQRNNASGAGSRAHAITVDAAGNAYITGMTTAVEFPTTADAFLRSRAGTAGFLSKLNAAGNQLLYSTFIGGQNTTAQAVALDAMGNIYVGGKTDDSFFPSGDAFGSPVRAIQIGTGSRTNSNLPDGFVVRFNAQGGLTGSICIGGGREDAVRALTVGDDGSIYITGGSQSTNYPTTGGAFAPIFKSDSITYPDAFLSRLDATLSQQLYGTYIGGRRADEGRGIALASDGSVWVAGTANSLDIPTTPSSIKPTRADDFSYTDGFLVRLDVSQPGASALRYGTFIGGDRAFDSISGLALDVAGDVWLTGKAGNPSGVTGDAAFTMTAGAYQQTARNDDGFLLKVGGVSNAQPGALLYASRIGGSGLDEAVAIAAGAGGSVAVVGQTVSPDLVTTAGAFQPALSCNPVRSQTDVRQDGFVARFTDPTVGGTGNNIATISGRIISNTGALLAGVTVRLTGGQSAVQQSGADGRYQFAGLLTGTSYTVTPEAQGYSFSPPLATTGNLSGDAQFGFTASAVIVSPQPPQVRRAPRPRGAIDTSITPGSLVAYTFSAAQPAGFVWDGQSVQPVGVDGVVHAPTSGGGYSLQAGGQLCEIHAVSNLGADPQNSSLVRLEIIAYVPEQLPTGVAVQLQPQFSGTPVDQVLNVQSERTAPAFWDDVATGRSIVLHSVNLLNFTAAGIDTGYQPSVGAVAGGTVISLFATGLHAAPNTDAGNDPSGFTNVAENFTARIVAGATQIPVQVTYAGRVSSGPGGIDQVNFVIPQSAVGLGIAELQVIDAHGVSVARILIR